MWIHLIDQLTKWVEHTIERDDYDFETARLMMGNTIEVHMLFRRARRRISENSVSLMEEILQQADNRMKLARATARAAYQLRYEQVLREAEREAGNVHRIEELEKQRRLFEGKERRLDTGT